MSTDVTVVLPVKRWSNAKTRLDVSPGERAALARGFCLDVLAVLRASEAVAHVVVVTDEPVLVDLGSDARTTVLVHGSHRGSRALNRAVSRGLAWARTHRPASPVVVLPGDLPALTGESLTQAIHALAMHERSFVPDHDGEGTTLLFGRTPEMLRPAYGRRSAAAHAASGHVPCADVDPRARLDVDTTDDLRRALEVGIGPETATACWTMRSAEEVLEEELRLHCAMFSPWTTLW